MNRAGHLALVAVLTAGCATHVPQVLDPHYVPKFFSERELSPELWPQAYWWQQFGSSELSDFVRTGQEDNRDLAVATAGIAQAHAQVVIQRAALFPQVTLQAQGQRAGARSNESSAVSGTVTGNAFELALGGSYSVDISGLARADLRAANETLKSSRFALQSVTLTVTANIADAYFSVLALRKRIAIANEDLLAINGILETIQLRVRAGSSSRLDLAQEQAQVESVEAQLPVLQEQELEARLSLAVLLGRTPEDMNITTVPLDTIHLPLVSPGLPSDLLQRRPDVAEAEAALASAHASVDAARAAFLPQFALTGSDGFASTALSTLVHGPSVVWEYGGNLLQAVFDGGRLVGQKKLAEGAQQELIASYQRAVLNAYADVEAALGQVRHNDLSQQHLLREVEAAQEAFQIAQLQYRQGTTDLLTVLQSQQTLFAAEDQLAQTALAHMQAVVHLYEALGGGWEENAREQTQLEVVKHSGAL